MAKRWEAVHLDELDSIPVTDTLLWRPVRRRLGIGAFGINAYTAANAGDEIVEDHTEQGSDHEEVYLVLRGRVEFTVDGETVDGPAGTFLFLRDPEVRRAAIAKEPGSAVLAVGGPRGRAFEPSAWEHYFMAIPHARAGDYAKARDVVREGAAEHGDHPGFLYNLACYESLAGDHEEALAHLQRAVKLDPNLVERAKRDADFDPIRDRADFPA
jgi:tetratricopeptide (TPR) repeat protein